MFHAPGRGSERVGEGFSDQAHLRCSGGRRIGSGQPPAQHKSIAGGCLFPCARCHSAWPGACARPVQVAAETTETAHTWQRRMPQRATQGRLAVRVAAETPESAHTWQQRASAMGKRRSCDGRPHRAIQTQAFCCTGRPRQTVRCRKWPCGVREARLSIGGCARRWQQEQVRRKVRHTSGGG